MTTYQAEAAVKEEPRVLLRVESKGKGYVDKTGRCWAVELIRPVAMVEFTSRGGQPFLLSSQTLTK